jgi:hypothetical protein
MKHQKKVNRTMDKSQPQFFLKNKRKKKDLFRKLKAKKSKFGLLSKKEISMERHVGERKFYMGGKKKKRR